MPLSFCFVSFYYFYIDLVYIWFLCYFFLSYFMFKVAFFFNFCLSLLITIVFVIEYIYIFYLLNINRCPFFILMCFFNMFIQ